MNLSTNPFFSHGIDKLCTICHVIFKNTVRTHSIFSTSEELESSMNVLQVLQSFSNFNFYNGAHLVCTTCYDKTIEVYKFIQMCNKAHDNMQHYLKYIEAMKTIKDIEKDELEVNVKVEEISIGPTRIIIDGREFLEEMQNENMDRIDELGMIISGTEIQSEEMILNEEIEKEEIKTTEDQTDVDVKVEEISFAPTRIIIDGREFLEEIENEKMGKFDELGMIIAGTEINIEERILEEAIEIEERSYNEEITISHTVIITEEKTDNKKELGDHRKKAKHTIKKQFLSTSFGTKYSLNNHDQTHNSQRMHISKDFRLNQDRHQQLKDHKTDVVCLECQKVFYTDTLLKIHMRSHKKKFMCNDCGKEFTRKANLNTHIRVHAANPFTCLTCKRGFAAPSCLRRHMDSHNGVKPHKCEQCDRRFTQASSLRSHMDIHN